MTAIASTTNIHVHISFYDITVGLQGYLCLIRYWMYALTLTLYAPRFKYIEDGTSIILAIDLWARKGIEIIEEETS